jgi:hypothetical protein
MPLSDISKGNENKSLGFTGSSAFLKDLGDVTFGTGKVSGPYPDGDKIIYVDFKELKIETDGKISTGPAENYCKCQCLKFSSLALGTMVQALPEECFDFLKNGSRIVL